MRPRPSNDLLPPREAVWRLTQAPSGLSVLESLEGGLLTMHGATSRPPWMLFVVPPASAMDATVTPRDLAFRVELDAASLKDDRDAPGRGTRTTNGAFFKALCAGAGGLLKIFFESGLGTAQASAARPRG